MPFLPCSKLPSSAGLSSCGNYVINCNNCSCNLCTEFLTQMLSKKQAKVIHVCLGFGGQDHVSKAVVKARPLAFRAGLLPSVANHGLRTKLLLCGICTHSLPNSTEKLGNENQDFNKWSFRVQDLTLEFKTSLRGEFKAPEKFGLVFQTVSE